MALHGNIQINGIDLWYWSAVRQRGGQDPDDINEYAWEAGSYEAVQTYTGRVTHRYGDGAVVLAKLVMEAVAERLTKVKT